MRNNDRGGSLQNDIRSTQAIEEKGRTFIKRKDIFSEVVGMSEVYRR
jgi:hypothetical protein